MEKTVDLIVPCFNEGEVLELFHSEVSAVLDGCEGYAFHFIFVNDGSKDQTLNLLRRFAAEDKRVRYLSLSRNFGKESAMLAGMKYSTGDYVGILDADLQHSPELIPEMLSALEEGYEIAAARRVDRSGEGKVKSVFSRAFYKVINRMSDVDIQDGAQDFRIMKRQVVEAILSMPEYNRFSKGIFSWVGFRTKWFEHENRERAAGSSKWSFAKLFRYALDGIIGFSTAPLKVSLYIGVASSGIGVIYALYILHSHAYSWLRCAGLPLHYLRDLLFWGADTVLAWRDWGVFGADLSRGQKAPHFPGGGNQYYPGAR